MSTETLTVASWNLPHNGRGDGDHLDRNDHGDALAYLASKQVDILFRQELTDAWDNGQQALFAEGNALGGLFPHMARPQEGKSRNPTGVLVNTQHFLITQKADHQMAWNTISGLRVQLKGCDKTLHLASAHLPHFSPALRATDADRLITLADHQRTALIGLDANSYPYRTNDETTDPIDWSTIEDRVHVQNRTVEREGKRVSDTRPSEILTAGHHGRPGIFIDLGHYAGTKLRQPNALKATANLQRVDQGPPQRIDWLLGTPDLLPALGEVEVVDTDEVKQFSNHALVIATFSLPRLHSVLTS